MMISSRQLSQLPSHIMGEHGQLCPQSFEDIKAILELANQEKLRLMIKKSELTQADSSTAMLNITQHKQTHHLDPQNLTAKVATGITLGELNRWLQPYDLMWPLALSPERTVLDILGENPLPLNRLGVHRLPRQVLGTETLTGDAQFIHYGGDVVKNVTGYDMSRLFIGSHHQFGLISSTTLRLRRRPEATYHSILHIDNPNHALTLVNQGRAQWPSCSSLVLYNTKQTFGWKLLIGLSGLKGQVGSDQSSVEAAMGRYCRGDDATLHEMTLSDTQSWHSYHQLDWGHQDPSSAAMFVVELSLPETHLLDWLLQWGDPKASVMYNQLGQPDFRYVVGSHTLMLRWRPHQLPPIDALGWLANSIRNYHGHIQVIQAPAGVLSLITNALPSWSEITSQWWRQLKTQFDPHQVLWTSPDLLARLSPTMQGASV